MDHLSEWTAARMAVMAEDAWSSLLHPTGTAAAKTAPRSSNVLVGQDQMWSVGRIVFSGRNGSDPINFWHFTDFEQGGQPTVFNDVRP